MPNEKYLLNIIELAFELFFWQKTDIYQILT